MTEPWLLLITPESVYWSLVTCDSWLPGLTFSLWEKVHSQKHCQALFLENFVDIKLRASDELMFLAKTKCILSLLHCNKS